MNTRDTGTLLKLSETAEVVSRTDEDIRDRRVRDRNGEDMGKIKDLLVDDSEGKVRFLEVASGGFLGIGQDETYVPVEAITSITDDEVRVDPTREHVAGAPVYDPELVRKREAYAGILDYYGVGPFWAPGYQYPSYPYYR
ncbi:PRC-barrel domain-containing protein [Microbacterium esteraromaticum]|uniref:PRC-barrel domain-containing protein n=1 Tax=Microbacterium esteraromaticum TaxID=57043 RepID=UPI001C96D9D0|nr:PRC-barrel domain-containing protein [Microbacterium esteraromaticum]MBY6061446.1 PRC-barrel domain-containing protein [Microbacterium esteraromaticum]